jgi:hypothetical protein
MPVLQATKFMPAFPPGFQSISIDQNSTVGIVASPFTAQQQVIEWPAQWWSAQVGLPPMSRAFAEEWVGFLLSLRGMAGSFVLGDPAGKLPRGAGSGNPVVDGANQVGNVISTRGWTPNTVNVLKTGDWMQIANRLYKCLAAEDANANGKASFEIWPDIRQNPNAPADGEPIVINSASGIFRLDKNKMTWSIDESMIYGLQFSCVEKM